MSHTLYRLSLYALVSASLLTAAFPSSAHAQQVASASVTTILPPALPAVVPVALPAPLASTQPLIVIGFAGGFISPTDDAHGEVNLALHLRRQYGPAVQSEVFANHHGPDAHREILRLIDSSTPSAPAINRHNARVILYGHSWGASEADDVARLLQRDGVPILLLVQVDGVAKHDHDDSIIPANVAQAINFYQTEGLLHGRPRITAADPRATRILGNIHLSYSHWNIPTPGYSWIARRFTHRHIQIENDPRVWSRVETMIDEAMLGTTMPAIDEASSPRLDQ